MKYKLKYIFHYILFRIAGYKEKLNLTNEQTRNFIHEVIELEQTSNSKRLEK